MSSEFDPDRWFAAVMARSRKANDWQFDRNGRPRGGVPPIKVALSRPENGEREFASQTDAARFLGCNERAVSDALRLGKQVRGWNIRRV